MLYIFLFSGKKLTEIQQKERTASLNGQTPAPVPAASNAQPVAPPAAPPIIPPLEVVAAPTAPIVTPAPTNASTPMIRVKTFESMKRPNPPPVVVNTKTMSTTTNPAPVPQIINSVKVTSSPAVQISTETVQRPSNANSYENHNLSTGTIASATDNNPTPPPPVKLWNKVIEEKSTGKPLDYLVVSNKNVASNTDKSVYCIKPTKDLIANANANGSSSLKIDQVFECVSPEFVEDLLVEKQQAAARPTPPPKTVSPSPLLDTLVNEVQQSAAQKQANKRNETTTEKDLTFACASDDSCSDYRCNICLKFNKSFTDHKLHMLQTHNCGFVCERCRDVFRNRSAYDAHMDASGQCGQRENTSRSFICIVDPPGWLSNIIFCAVYSLLFDLLSINPKCILFFYFSFVSDFDEEQQGVCVQM